MEPFSISQGGESKNKTGENEKVSISNDLAIS